MKSFSACQMRTLDSETIAENIHSGIELMTAAGRAAAGEITAFAAERKAGRFAVLTGKGNNGGDGFVVAGALAERFGPDRVTLFPTAGPDELTGDAKLAYDAMPDALKLNAVRDFQPGALPRDTILVDALIGIGFSGALRDPFRSLIQAVNASGLPVVSIDLPSALNADTGLAPDGAVRADLTVTFSAPKNGLLLADGPRYCGRLAVCGIGIPEDALSAVPDALEVTDTAVAKKLAALRRLDWNTHKYRRGCVTVIGGSGAYPSAPLLTAEAALRAGAGIVNVIIPASAHSVGCVPRALIVQKIEDGGFGCFQASSLPEILPLLTKSNAVAVGPGMTRSHGCLFFLRGLLENLHVPVVLDADALNLLSENPGLTQRIPKGSVLTPHPGEMNRLLAAFALDEEKLTGLEQARNIADLTGQCTVLKYARTIVCEPGTGRISVNLSGSPALATAGSGDVLTGILAAALAGGMTPYDAARYAVHLHGLTGELAPAAIGAHAPCDTPLGVIADDLIRALPAALSALAV